METTTLPPRGKLTLRYYLLQIGFWGGIGCFTGFQSVIVLDRGFTSADVGVFVAVCNMAGILFQPQLGAWADRHPEIPLKKIFLCCILTALGLNMVFLFTRPGFWLTALFFALMGMAEVNSFTLIDSMAMQYINAGADLPYSRGRGLGSLAYALICILVGRQTAAFGMQSALVTHAVMLVLLALFTLSFPAFPRAAREAGERRPSHSTLAILRGNLPFTLMLLGGFFGMMAIMPVDNFLINMIEDLGGDSSDLGLALFLKAASELPAAFLFEWLYRKIGSQKVLLIGVAFMIAKPILFLLSGSLAMLLLVQPVQMLGYGLFTPAVAYFANENVAPEDRVQGQSMKSVMTAGLASVMGNLISGYAVKWGGPSAMLIFGIVSGCIGLLFAASAMRMSRRRTAA